MRFPRFRTTAVLLLLASAMPVSAAHATQVPTVTRQSLRVIAISDHCVDEFDEEETIFINEGDTACKMTVQVRGRAKTKSKVLLQYQDYDDGWISAGYKTLTTNASGKATFTLETDFPSEPGDDCYDNDSYTHRFAIARTGKYKAFKSATFEVSYTSSDTNPACLGYDE
ncbi:MAG: hypothetical protein F2618_00720 [Actinobacteria bacterium]|nr:hypothetical protein [Actinomycetota bacterium]